MKMYGKYSTTRFLRESAGRLSKILRNTPASSQMASPSAITVSIPQRERRNWMIFMSCRNTADAVSAHRCFKRASHRRSRRFFCMYLQKIPMPSVCMNAWVFVSQSPPAVQDISWNKHRDSCKLILQLSLVVLYWSKASAFSRMTPISSHETVLHQTAFH